MSVHYNYNTFIQDYIPFIFHSLYNTSAILDRKGLMEWSVYPSITPLHTYTVACSNVQSHMSIKGNKGIKGMPWDASKQRKGSEQDIC
jgi:hypothetical protein